MGDRSDMGRLNEAWLRSRISSGDEDIPRRSNRELVEYQGDRITVVILELIHAEKPRLLGGVYLLDKRSTGESPVW